MTRKTNLQLCTASAVGAEAAQPGEVLTALRKGGTEFQACIAGLEDYLEEPLKSKFAEVKKQINLMLAGLPATDAVPAAQESNAILRQLLCAFQTAQMMISTLNEQAKTASARMAATTASLTGEVEKAINARISSGELVAKAEVEKRITDATAAATSAAREAIAAETKLLGERRQQLVTASIPAPADELLKGEAKEFDARKATAQKRIEELKPFGLDTQRQVALAWNTDQANYDLTLALLKEIQDKVKGGKVTAPNPFITGTGADAAPKVLGVC